MCMWVELSNKMHYRKQDRNTQINGERTKKIPLRVIPSTIETQNFAVVLQKFAQGVNFLVWFEGLCLSFLDLACLGNKKRCKYLET